ncbi:spermidine synthase [Streptomyces hainanensis]|uniref:Spermidine synthase n=1 Tax=Streptomyces hainanensis TaxID=402648 RepID=A0A4R4TLX5_9ACTN|nr:spermidine synthase [Streptomyces hainanensis]TDC77606.1 spermidine synthase [Streptomyces hainanensis]
MASAPFPDSAAPALDDGPVVLARGEGPYGEVVLRRHGALLQIIANGCFLMDTSDGRSERLLVTEAFAALADHPSAAPPDVLIGGLGVGFSLAAAAAEPGWGGITVLERESAVIDWHRAGPLGELTAAALADPRVRLVHGDLLAHLHEVEAGYDALCLDVDNGPDWTVTEDNEGLYSPAGLAACRAALRPGGVLVVWSARGSERFVKNLRKAGFTGVGTREVPVARGVPDVLFLASHHLASQSA